MNYKLIGQRNLRKYTEPKTSPTYAAAIEAQTIVDALCGVPWKNVSAKDAVMTYHTEEPVGEVDGQKINGLEMNVRIRDQFDAALFCAEHSGGQHRAYANAAVYHYVLPDGTLPKLTKLTASVTSDPYNSSGARITILTNATGAIPTNCNECRTGDAHADGVAPRTVAENGNWFPTMADCVFSATPGEGEVALPSGGLQLQKHLFVFVLMESYSTVRGNWLEGCSFIKNEISIETDAAVPGWTDGETYDLSEPDGPWYSVYRYSGSNKGIEHLFHVPPESKVKFDNGFSGEIPKAFCVEHDDIKSTFGHLDIKGKCIIQRNVSNTNYVKVDGQNCQFVSPDYKEVDIRVHYPNEIDLDLLISRPMGFYETESWEPHVGYNESGNLVNVYCELSYADIGRVANYIVVVALMDRDSGEIKKMCFIDYHLESETAGRVFPGSDFEPLDFFDTSPGRGSLYQNKQGVLARPYLKKNAGSAANENYDIEIGSSLDGKIESCNAIPIQVPGYESSVRGKLRVFAGSKVDFMTGDKMLNRIFAMRALGNFSTYDEKRMLEMVIPIFGKDYDLRLDDYTELNAYLFGVASPYDTMLIAGQFRNVNGVVSKNGWAILRLNQRLDDNNELITDYVNVIPMLLPQMKYPHILSADMDGFALRSLVALGIVED